MGKEETNDLMTFLEPFPESVRETALWLREFVWDLYPDSNELIYDNYNALAIGFSPSDRTGDAFCHIAVYSKHVNFGFNRGSEIADPEKKLLGIGSQVRHLKVNNKGKFPRAYVKRLLKEARQNSLAKLKEGKQTLKGATIVKSISPVKRRPQS